MPKLISLYTGAGGLDLGFESAGFETSVAVEMNPDAVETLRANRDWPVISRDIHDVPSELILSEAGLKEGEADTLIGGPPCQPFSKSGYWASGDTRRLSDPRTGTLGAYFRVLRDTLPKVFLLENVPGLAYRRKSEGLDMITRSIQTVNQKRNVSYRWAVAKLNAADFGVPQMRERVFVIGARDGTEFTFPETTHRSPETNAPLFPPDLETWRTAWDAIGDLQDDDDPELLIRGKWAELLPSIPEGNNYLWHTERGGGLELFGWRRRYWSFLLKLSKHRPSWTLQAQPGPAIGPFHWKNRRLSARELCRIQTIPDEYTVTGSLPAVQRQLGNAVPSALAEVLARSIRSQFLGTTKIDLTPSLIPKRRQTIPAAEKTRKVPEQYQHLVGNHEPHPGTGLGYAASKRKSSSSRRGNRPTLPLSARTS